MEAAPYTLNQRGDLTLASSAANRQNSPWDFQGSAFNCLFYQPQRKWNVPCNCAKGLGPRHKPSFWVANRTLEALDLSHLWTVILWGHKTCINKMFSQCFNHSCFHMGKGPASLTNTGTFTEKMYYCYRPTMKNQSIHRFPPIFTSWIHSQHCHSVYFFSQASQKQFLILKVLPSHYLAMPSPLPLYSVTWSPQHEGNTDSLSDNKQITDSVLRSRE